jgi:hypothetical protein
MTPFRRLLAGSGVLVLTIIGLLWIDHLQRNRDWTKPLTDLEVTQAWLHCIDCQGPFLKQIREAAVRRGGDTVIKALESALLAGPSAAQKQRVRNDLLRTWRADSAYHSGPHWPTPIIHPGPGITLTADSFISADSQRSRFLSRYERGFELRWRGRAATALGVIRSPRAMAALDSVLKILPADNRLDTALIRTIETARDSGSLALQHYR